MTRSFPLGRWPILVFAATGLLTINALLFVYLLGESYKEQEAEALRRRPQLVIDPGMHTAAINQIVVDAAERFLVTASEDKTLGVWSLPEGNCLKTLRPRSNPGNTGGLSALALSPDGRQLVYKGAGTNSLYVFDLQTGNLTSTIGLCTHTLHLDYSADGRFLVACLAGDGIRVINTETLKLAYEDRYYTKSCNGAAFFPDGRLVATSDDGDLRLYDANFTMLARVATPGGKHPYQLCISPNGQEIAVGFSDTPAINIFSGLTGCPRLQVPPGPLTSRQMASWPWPLLVMAPSAGSGSAMALYC